MPSEGWSMWFRRVLNPTSRLRRWSLKTSLVVVTVLLVAYPNPAMLVRNIGHWSEPAVLADPDAPGIPALAYEVVRSCGPNPQPNVLLREVQNVVQRTLPYAHDWETWGVADYIPTAEEAIAMGREDCDGRAVVAAAILKRLGIEARILTDGSHVWVSTPLGDTMSPMPTRSGRTLLAASSHGVSLDWLAIVSPGGLMHDVPTDIAYGIAAFPLKRELIVVAVTWLVLLGATPHRKGEILTLSGLIVGLLILRITGADPWHRSVLGAWSGFSVLAAGFVGAWWPRRCADPAFSTVGVPANAELAEPGIQPPR